MKNEEQGTKVNALGESLQNLLLRDLSLAKLVAFVDSGGFDKCFQSIESGMCNWCLKSGPVLRLPDDLVKRICQECFSIGLEAIRAAAAGDAQAYSALERELNLRWVNTIEVVH